MGATVGGGDHVVGGLYRGSAEFGDRQCGSGTVDPGCGATSRDRPPKSSGAFAARPRRRWCAVSWVLIGEAGKLVHYSYPVTAAGIQAVMPSGNFDLVRLHQHPDLFGFVDDSGHLLGLPPNDVGSCVLVEFGAAAYAYAGPIVIGGWQEPDDTSEIRDLTLPQLASIAATHMGVRLALAGFDATWLRLDAPSLRQYAAWVNDSPTPEIQLVVSGAKPAPMREAT